MIESKTESSDPVVKALEPSFHKPKFIEIAEAFLSRHALAGLALIVASLFFSFPFRIPGVGYTVVKLCDPILAIFIAITSPVWLRVGGFEFIPNGVRKGIVILVLVFTGWFILGLYLRQWSYDSVDLRKFMSLYLGLAFLLVGLKFGSLRLSSKAVRIYILVAALVSSYSVLRHYLSFLGIDHEPWYPRTSGFVEGPNTLAYTLAIALGLALCFPRPRSLDALSIAVLMLGVMLAASRAVFFGVVLMFPYLVISRAVSVRRLVKGTIVAGMLYLVLYPGVGWYRDDGDSICKREAEASQISAYKGCSTPFLFQREMTSDNSRFEVIAAELDVISRNPLMGVGLGSFVHLTDGKLDHHNSVLWLLSEFGVVGSTLVLASLFAIFFNGWQRPDLASFEAKALVALIILAAGSSVGMTLFYERFFWFLAGLLVAATHVTRDRSGST